MNFWLVPIVAVNIILGPCPAPEVKRSCYDPHTDTIHLAAVDRTNPYLRRSVLAHEYGHAYADHYIPELTYSEQFANDFEDCALGFYTRRNRRFCLWLYNQTPSHLVEEHHVRWR